MAIFAAQRNLWDHRRPAHYFHQFLDPQCLIWQLSMQCSSSAQVQASELHELPVGSPAKASHQALPPSCCMRPLRGDQPQHPATVTIQGTAELMAWIPCDRKRMACLRGLPAWQELACASKLQSEERRERGHSSHIPEGVWLFQSSAVVGRA